MIIHDVFECYELDEEGRNSIPGSFVLFHSQKMAELWKGNGHNSAWKRIQPKTITVYESYDEFMDHATGKLKEQALKKLTSAERKALGF